MKIRLSLATASALGLKPVVLAAKTTTLYLMLLNTCSANCKYCTQHKGYLSRVKWPIFELDDVCHVMQHTEAQRICIQCPSYENNISDAINITQKLNSNIPISLSIGGLDISDIRALKKGKIDRLGIGLDCATEMLFKKWKQGAPSFESYMNTLFCSKEIFGHATCHLIVGLGETDKELISLMKNLTNNGITIALFAYYDGVKTVVSKPRYRALQLAYTQIKHGKGNFIFDNEGTLTDMELSKVYHDSFMTSGCPGCNRPFYNERVTSIYNYPYFPKEVEIKQGLKEAHNYANICTVAE